MKKNIILVSLLFGAIMFGACTHHHHHHTTIKRIPPGHAKKMAGTKSAKPFAPGQQKKK